jgi:hypothetical protein
MKANEKANATGAIVLANDTNYKIKIKLKLRTKLKRRPKPK